MRAGRVRVGILLPARQRQKTLLVCLETVGTASAKCGEGALFSGDDNGCELQAWTAQLEEAMYIPSVVHV